MMSACHNRTHSSVCVQPQLKCNDISQQWTLRQAINKADELQTTAAIIPELLMDCILIVSANTLVTFYMTAEAPLYTSSSCFNHPVCQNNMVKSRGGGCYDGEVGGVNCCDYHRWEHGEGEVWQVELSLRNATVHRNMSMFTAQVNWTLRWINTVLMKWKHVKTLFSVLTPMVFSAVCTCMSVYAAFHRPRAEQWN